jgi:hypothetical protein
LNCSDGNACTSDACGPFAGCENTPVAAGTPCDDGEPCTWGDSCAGGLCVGGPDVCSTPNLIFVSSASWNVSIASGLAGADAVCNADALVANLTTDADPPFVALLPSSAGQIQERLGAARGFVRPDGQPVADTVTQLLAGELWLPITLDAFSNSVTGELVATGVLACDALRFIRVQDTY